MNKKSIAQIMSIIQSIRGITSGIDYPFIILPILLMKWAELKNGEEGFEAYKEIFSLPRLASTYGTADKASDVIQYLVDIENYQKKVLGGYISEAGAVIDQIPPKDYSDILSAVEQMKIEKSPEIYSIAREILLFASKYYGNRMNPIMLSGTGVREIEKCVLSQAHPAGTVFDGFAGSGLSSLDVIEDGEKAVLIDSNPRNACIAEIMSILRGCEAEIYVDDSFNSEKVNDVYGIVTIEPPFGLRGMRDIYDSLPYYDSDTDAMCIKYALHVLKEGGTATVLCPGGVLFKGGRTEKSRKELIESKSIDAVIQLPAGAIIGSAVSTAIIVLKKYKTDEDILFIDASALLINEDKSDLVLTEENSELLRGILQERRNEEGISVLVPSEEVSKHEYSLVVGQYINGPEETVFAVDTIELKDRYEAITKRMSALNMELTTLRNKYL